MNSSRFKNIIFQIILFMFISSPLFAKTEGEGVDLEAVVKVMIAVTAFTIAFIMWLILVYAEKNDTEGDLFKSPFKAAMQWFSRATPLEEEHKILMSHDYDGIKELDNRIPPWFSFLFYGTIIFSIIYMINYHVIGSGDVQAEEYIAEMNLAKEQKALLTRSGALLDETTVVFDDSPGSLANGKDIFTIHCAACHANDGGGLVGPNFTDEYWIHGGGIRNIFKVIRDGVPAKGMISWQTKLSPTEMQEVGSYIITLQGTTPAFPKSPEGDKWDSSMEEAAGEDLAMKDKGVGPIVKLELSEIDPALAGKGDNLFVLKCSSCHKIDKRFVGPALRGVTERRSPEWIMNMILDPDKMVKENPTARDLLAEYLSPMANQSLTQDEARAILEYFRTQTSQ